MGCGVVGGLRVAGGRWGWEQGECSTVLVAFFLWLLVPNNELIQRSWPVARAHTWKTLHPPLRNVSIFIVLHNIVFSCCPTWLRIWRMRRWQWSRLNTRLDKGQIDCVSMCVFYGGSICCWDAVIVLRLARVFWQLEEGCKQEGSCWFQESGVIYSIVLSQRLLIRIFSC